MSEDSTRFAFSSHQMSEAQSSGLSPSSTEESNSKGPGLEATSNDDRKTSISNAEEKPAEEPESNDTSYGVEATAVRTLAASTGTVAILGTTAHSQSQKDLRKVDESPEKPSLPPEAALENKTDDKTAGPDTGGMKVETKEKAEDVDKTRETATEKIDAPSPEGLKVESTSLSAPREEVTVKEGENSVPEKALDVEKPDEVTSTEEKQKVSEEKQPSSNEPAEQSVPVEKKEEHNLPLSTENAVDVETERQSDDTKAETPSVGTESVLSAIEKKEPTPSENLGDSSVQLTSQTEKSEKNEEKKEELIENPVNDEKQLGVKLVEEVPDTPVDKEEKSTEHKDENHSPGQEENTESLSTENDVSFPSPDANTRTNEEEDNDISSEQLKTNSLSDMSMSETAQLELEDKSETRGPSLTLDVENVGLEEAKQLVSPMIEVNSPSENSGKNNSDQDKTPDLLPDSKTDTTSLEDKSQNSNLSGDSPDLNAAATTIQSNIRGFLTRRHLKKSQNSSTEDVSKKLTDSMIDKIKDEVDEICKEAEKTTESLISSPDIDKGAIAPNEEFPAPPDDMLTDKLEETLEEDTTSLNSQPTVPSSASQKETKEREQKGEKPTSAKQQHALDVAPPPPADLDDNSAADSEQLPNDEDLPAPDFEMFESSYTDDVNTEIINSDKVGNVEDLKDSTEGDLTIDEDSDKLLKELQKPQECDELVNVAAEIIDQTKKEIDDAATKIQAGVRGYLTRKQQNVKNKRSKQSIEEADRASIVQTPSDHQEEASAPEDSLKALEKDINDAATKIQANFRGYMVRKEGKNKTTDKEVKDLPENLSPDETQTKEESVQPSGHPEQTGSDLDPAQNVEKEGELQEVNSKNASKDLSLKKEDIPSEDLINDSAIKIQAEVRGYLTRKKLQTEKEAAAKIQAGFKGYKVRQQIKEQK
ncbi:uncharacterized protein LOC106666574 isoform X1 [Cimex lectularius]|uniref:Uncharacterized protein n=1 Tax=Cimex lectularius TaxID=79782 RepID=A0A8I6SK01_CIMLE|nr:uncharacterized protein LOC106666574 isoform X1 [Cimex lectularius]